MTFTWLVGVNYKCWLSRQTSIICL